jgi:hypothetical protein
MIEFIILQASPQPTDSNLIEYLMRGTVTLLFGLVLWGIKSIHAIRKQNTDKITNLDLKYALMQKDIEHTKEINEKLDNQYETSFQKIEGSLETLLDKVCGMELQITTINTTLEHLDIQPRSRKK